MTLKGIIPHSLEQRVKTRFESWLLRAARKADRDIDSARFRLAAEDSAGYLGTVAPMAESYTTKEQLLTASLSAATITGLYLEFGVFRGGTINQIASKVGQKVHGFDSFEGLPEAWRPDSPAGAFKVDNLPVVASNVVLHKGWFNDTLPPFLKEYRDPVAFLHVDCDLYSSTKTIFDILGAQIVPGTVIQFDEFLNYPGWRSGEYKAFQEFCAGTGAKVDYLGYVTRGEQLAVRIV